MSVLTRIFDVKREEVAAAKAARPLDVVKQLAAAAGPTRGFARALAASSGIALIAEVKKASPSKGVIRADFDAPEVARSYERAGAQALSVLTDEPHFQGSAENLRRAREATQLPCLRKDFINDPYQVYEARAWGADAVLLIVAALSDEELIQLHALVRELGMDALVEVHTEDEMDRALRLGAGLIGVNNRDLGDFHTDLAVTDRLVPKAADRALVVSESAIETHADVCRVAKAGARAVLIGTTFCAATDIEAKVHEVMGR